MNNQDIKVVLVVDDDALVRNSVAAFLREKGIAVLVAQYGAEAVKMAEVREGAIDLLISDIKMPGMSGTVLASLFNEKWPRTKVLLMSAFEGCEWATVTWDFIVKPFSGEHLIARVRALLLE